MGSQNKDHPQSYDLNITESVGDYKKRQKDVRQLNPWFPLHASAQCCGVSDPLRSGAPSSWGEHARELRDGAIKAIVCGRGISSVSRTKTIVYSEEGPENEFEITLLFK